MIGSVSVAGLKEAMYVSTLLNEKGPGCLNDLESICNQHRRYRFERTPNSVAVVKKTGIVSRELVLYADFDKGIWTEQDVLYHDPVVHEFVKVYMEEYYPEFEYSENQGQFVLQQLSDSNL